MGSSSSISNFEVALPLESEWVKESRQSYCAVLRNIETGEQAEQYVVASNESISNELERYEYRLNQNQNLVSTWAVQVLNDDGVCNGTHRLLVTNQRIPLRLSEVRGLNFKDSLTVIYSSLVGFNAIHNVEGYVAVNDEMIGFTTDHRVKVWLNQNFSQNHPSLPHRMVNHQYTASTMIEEIITIVEQHSSEPLLPDFRNYFHSRFSPTGNFAGALTIVRDYAQMNGIVIDGRMTFAEGRATVIPSNEYRTSYVYPEQVEQTHYVETIPATARSTILQQTQPTVTIIQEPSVKTLYAQPASTQQYQILQEPMVTVAPPVYINPPIASIPINPIHNRVVSPQIVNNRAMAKSVYLGPQHLKQANFTRSIISSPTQRIQNSAVFNLPSQPIVAQSHVTRPYTTLNEKINIAPVSLALPVRNLTPTQQKEVTSAVIKTESPKKVQVLPKSQTVRQITSNHKDFIPNDKVGRHIGSSLREAQHFLQSLDKNQIIRPPRNASPQPIVNLAQSFKAETNPKLNNLFEKKQEMKKVQVVQNTGFEHKIGQTLTKYGVNGGVIRPQNILKTQSPGSTNQQRVIRPQQPNALNIKNGASAVVSPISSITSAQNTIANTKPQNVGLYPTPIPNTIMNTKSENAGLLANVGQSTQNKGATYVTPKLQINQIRTINIDGVTSSTKLEQLQDIFTYQQPKNAVTVQSAGTTQGVAQGLQNAIRQIDRDISISSSHPRGEGSVLHTTTFDNKVVTSEFAHKKDDDLIQYMKGHMQPKIEEKIEQEMREDWNADTIGGSERLLSKEVQEVLKNYESRKDYGQATYGTYESKYKSSSYHVEDPILIFNEDTINKVETRYAYDKPTDDYEALKAKYQTKYESNKQTETLYDRYKTEYDGDHKYDGEHKYESYSKSYISAQNRYNIDDPLIIFNTKKQDVLIHNKSEDYSPLDYKESTSYGGDYNSYLKQDNHERKDKYQRFDTYNKIDAKYTKEDKHSARESKYGNGGRNDKLSKYEKKYRAGKEERENRYSKRYEQRRQSGYPGESRTKEREYIQESRGRNLSYHDLRSLLYD